MLVEKYYPATTQTVVHDTPTGVVDIHDFWEIKSPDDQFLRIFGQILTEMPEERREVLLNTPWNTDMDYYNARVD